MALDHPAAAEGQRQAPLNRSAVVLGEALEKLFASLAELPTADSVEHALIARAIKLAGGNVAEAAKALGMSRATIYRRIRKDEVAS